MESNTTTIFLYLFCGIILAITERSYGFPITFIKLMIGLCFEEEKGTKKSFDSVFTSIVIILFWPLLLIAAILLIIALVSAAIFFCVLVLAIIYTLGPEKDKKSNNANGI